MQIVIKDMNGHEMTLKRPHGTQFGLEILIELNDGSDPTEIQLTFDQPSIAHLERAINFFA